MIALPDIGLKVTRTAATGPGPRRSGSRVPVPGGVRRVAQWMAAALPVAMAAALLLVAAPRPAQAMELCSPESLELMRSVGITGPQIRSLCAKAAQARHRLTLSVAKTEDAMGYCRVRLVLANLSTEPVDSLVLTVERARFEPFRFTGIPPGGTGYASSNSRILLDCDELREVKLVFHWPPSLRVAGRVLSGRRLLYYRPQLLDPALAWTR